jgi:hypothetical protein
MGVATTIALVSLALSAYSAYKAGKDAKKAGEAQQTAAESEAQLAEYNADVAELQAKDAVERGAEVESKFRTQVRNMVGAQRAGIAAGNIDVGYGSAVDVQADAAYLGELDALTIRTNAAREAWGYQVEATNLKKRAEIARKTGYYAAQAGKSNASTAYLQGAANIATGAATLLMNRYGFKNPTTTPGARTSVTLDGRGDATPGTVNG